MHRLLLKRSLLDLREDSSLEEELTIVLDLSILEEKREEEGFGESAPPLIPPNFAQFFNNEQFSDFTITGRDGLSIKAHKVQCHLRKSFETGGLNSDVLIVNRVSDSLHGDLIFFFFFRQISSSSKPHDFSASIPFISLVNPNQ